MSLHFVAKVNGRPVGSVVIRRTHPLTPDRYKVTVDLKGGGRDGDLRSTSVEHHYDDGWLVLVLKALAAIREEDVL